TLAGTGTVVRRPPCTSRPRCCVPAAMRSSCLKPSARTTPWRGLCTNPASAPPRTRQRPWPWPTKPRSDGPACGTPPHLRHPAATACCTHGSAGRACCTGRVPALLNPERKLSVTSEFELGLVLRAGGVALVLDLGGG